MSLSLALDWIIKIEGGYVNDPDDPGGETKYGISKRAFPTEDIRNLTEERARFLYAEGYWTPGCSALDKISPALAVAYFDMVVNSGRTAARRVLYSSMGFDPDTAVKWTDVEARVRHLGTDAALIAFLLERVFFLNSLAHSRKYIRGWINRQRALKDLLV